MTTPTCNHCGTKFPGKDLCSFCGLDPNSPVTFEERIRRATSAVKKLNKALKPYAGEFRAHERRAEKAAVRSVTNQPKKRKHGRHI